MQSGNEMFAGYEHASNTVPAGSRLAQYLHGANPQSSVRPTTWTTTLMHSQPINPPYSLATPNAVPTSNVPSFVPSFAQMNLVDDKDVPVSPYTIASSSQRPSNFASSSSHTLTPSPIIHDPLRPSGHVVQAGDANSAPSYMQENYGGTTYFFPPGQNAVVDQQRLDQQEDRIQIDNMAGFIYRAPPPNVGRFKVKGGAGYSGYFTVPELRYELLNRQLAISSHADTSAYPDLPQSVEQYHDLVPLENPKLHFSSVMDKSVFGSHISTVYKAISARDGMPYCIRRIHNYRLTQPKQATLADNWKKLVQVNVVQLRDVIITRQFGDTSLLFVYDYHPMSETLKAKHFDNQLNGLNANFTTVAKINAVPNMIAGGVQESVLWTYVVQLSSALRTIHGSGMAARAIDLTKIIVFSKTKLMLSSCGVLDVIAHDASHNAIHHQQQEDLVALGRVLAALACNSSQAGRRETMPLTLQLIAQHYSNDMKNLIALLLTPGNRRNINDIMPMIGARFYSQVENMQVKADLLENELSKELENGRLFRLLCKLCCIIDRPDVQMGMAWSDTGDRFLLKLFREYLFHQVTENGKPWIDMAHIITCLNKLDAGYPEKIQLVSSDGDNILIVSYSELKQCVENSFRELTNTTAPPAMAPLIPIVGPR